MKCFNYGNLNSNNIIIQVVDDHDLSLIDNEIKYINLYTNIDYKLICILVDDWFKDLTPWSSKSIYGNHDFGDGASNTLNNIIEEVVKPIYEDNKKFIIAGYSLAGLFSLWSITKCNLIYSCVACSPSVWYPKFLDYFKNSDINCDNIYLSLGDKESNSKNKVMASVKEKIEELYNILIKKNINTTLKWNNGGHFKDSDLRLALGISDILNSIK